MNCNKCSDKIECKKFLLPINDLISILSGKWKIRIIMCIASGTKGFNEIKNCHEISPKILSKELKTLLTYNIIEKTQDLDNLRSFNYSITPQGEKLIPIIIQLREWGQDYRKGLLSRLNKN
ncbi:MAG: helix-turn-helix transcriptional regulator [Marinifilaceae bacterium]|jgi:DNA-binding HxlR family transcriptional regulator|nr:helix-turn-helix transcriptional regulator [Marinifilaceae bacterium]